ncbi:MAG: hypothetical protein QM610_07665 [Chitinophagaceae bacterium]
MKIDSTRYFDKDVQNLPKNVQQKLGMVMANLMRIESLDGISNLKKMTVKGYYRIRIMDWRIGFKYEEDTNTLLFLVAKHRREIYDDFPPK